MDDELMLTEVQNTGPLFRITLKDKERVERTDSKDGPAPWKATQPAGRRRSRASRGASSWWTTVWAGPVDFADC